MNKNISNYFQNDTSQREFITRKREREETAAHGLLEDFIKEKYKKNQEIEKIYTHSNEFDWQKNYVRENQKITDKINCPALQFLHLTNFRHYFIDFN